MYYHTQNTGRKEVMEQFNLFPPLGATKSPLPHPVLDEAQQLLAELLSAMLEPSTPLRPNGEDVTHE